MKRIKIAVVGNPNTGKTTFINGIAGTDLHIGNWAGVTIEKKEAVFKYKNYEIYLIDLPGIYSLSNDVAEEKITFDYLTTEKPDVVINVIDITNLERNLYLTIQLMEMELPLVLALNMCDEAKKEGIEVNYKKLSRFLCAPAIPISAKKKEGIFKVLDKAIEIYEKGFPKNCELKYKGEIEEEIKRLETVIEKYQPELLNKFPKRFLILSILEGNYFFIGEEIKSEILKEAEFSRKKLERLFERDISTIIIEARYSIVIGIYKSVIKKRKKENAINLTLKLDNIFLNKYLGFPIFIFIIWILFNATFQISTPYVDWLDSLINNLIIPYTYYLLTDLGVSDWFKSLILDGIITGVGFVLVFIPVLFLLYLFMAFLEESGYMSRVAFLMDRVMSIFGLNGKSFIPLILGFGCNVPAVYSTRTLEDYKIKVLTVLLIPFMSCGARLTVFVFFTTIFFEENKALVILFLYLLGIFVAGVVAFILQKFIIKEEASHFIFELPPYRLPSFKYMLKYSWIKTKAFIKDAGSFILATSVIIWFLLHIPFGVKNLEDSLFGKISSAIAPIFEPLGFGNWQATGSLISGFVAKEVVIATMGNIYAEEIKENIPEKTTFKEFNQIVINGFIDANLEALKSIPKILNINIFGDLETEEDNNSKLMEAIRKSFTPISALSFLVFLLLYTPCMATIAAIKQELNSYKWVLVSVSISLSTAWIVSFIVYNLGKFLINV